MLAADAAVKQMRRDGATGELDGNVVSGVAPPLAVLAVGSPDKLFELVVHMPAQVLGRVDFEPSEQALEFCGQMCDARVAADLSARAANDELETLGTG